MLSQTIRQPVAPAIRRPAIDTRRPTLTGQERNFDANEIIVSKTDPKGIITYVNEVFVRVSQYSEDELLGAPHSIVRHPAMPRCIFRFMWDTIKAKKELFAYVLNRSKSGAHYWVFAHVTPTLDEKGNIISYHSSRRRADRRAIGKAQELYDLLLREEQKHRNGTEAMAASLPMLVKILQDKGLSYEEFVFTL